METCRYYVYMELRSGTPNTVLFKDPLPIKFQLIRYNILEML